VAEKVPTAAQAMQWPARRRGLPWFPVIPQSGFMSWASDTVSVDPVGTVGLLALGAGGV
jgi:hypothetical protein